MILLGKQKERSVGKNLVEKSAHTFYLCTSGEGERKVFQCSAWVRREKLPNASVCVIETPYMDLKMMQE